MKKSIKSFIALILFSAFLIFPLNSVFARAEDSPTKTVTSESKNNISGSADIVFLIDSTGSMEPYITSVKENLVNFVTYLKENAVSLNMSVVEYRDIEEDGMDSTQVHYFGDEKWTSDVNEVIEVFDTIKTSGGGDIPETPIDAFEKISSFPRDDANKFVFLLSDADYKDYEDTESNHNSNHYSMEAWTEIFRNNDIKVTVVSKNEYEYKYNYLYTITGGRFIDINSTNYYELMREYSEWIYENTIDSDRDGLPDDWEINGVDANHDGVVDIDLASMGADPNIPDIFIEADWMEYGGDDFNFLWIHEKINQKNTAPSANALKKIYDQFKSHGINIHIDAGPGSVMNYDTGEKWGALSGATALAYQDIFYVGDNFENWNQTAMDNFTRERWTTFRYCLFVNQYDAGNGNRSSGIAENIPGQFFIVASGCIGGSDYDTALAGTFMHELGHTLGLSHGGLYTDTSTSKATNNHTNYKPNHLSIMNYTYQFSGIKTVLGDFVINYQDFKLPQIDEKHINESSGIDPEGATDGKGLTIKIPVKNKFLFWEFDDEKDASIARQSIDFNRNGTIETDVEYDLNLDGKYENLTSTLNEWNNLRFDGCLIGGYGEEINVDEVSTLIKKSELNNELDELSIDEAFEKGLLGNPGECQFDDINSKKLFAEQTKQSFSFTITNLYPESTEVKLTVSSGILSTDFTDDIDVDKDGTTVEIFVKDNLKKGDYKVSYSMILKNGKTITETGNISIVDPNSISMNVGETENIPIDSVISCKTSNDSIVEVKDNQIIAKRKGVAYITIISTNDVHCAKIKVTDTDATPIGWVLGGIALLILLVGGGIVAVVVFTKKSKSDNDADSELEIPEHIPMNIVMCSRCGKTHPSNQPCECWNEQNKDQITEDAECSTGFIQVTNGSMNGFSVPIKDGETLYLGKDPKFANLVFTSDYKNVSRMHCAITFDAKANRYFVTDSSSNGTYLISKKRLIKGKRTSVNINTVLILANDECTVLLG